MEHGVQGTYKGMMLQKYRYIGLVGKQNRLVRIVSLAKRQANRLSNSGAYLASHTLCEAMSWGCVTSQLVLEAIK
jgi:hypothetical protein